MPDPSATRRAQKGLGGLSERRHKDSKHRGGSRSHPFCPGENLGLPGCRGVLGDLTGDEVLPKQLFLLVSLLLSLKEGLFEGIMTWK